MITIEKKMFYPVLRDISDTYEFVVLCIPSNRQTRNTTQTVTTVMAEKMMANMIPIIAHLLG